MSKVFVAGDTHGNSDLSKIYNFDGAQAKGLTKDDVLIQLGDWGAIWSSTSNASAWTINGQEDLLEWWANKDYTVAVILGNHENYDIIDTLPWTTKWGNDTQYYEIENGNKIYILKRGAIYTINDKKILAISGADSIDKHFRSEGIDWWERENINSEEIEFCLDEMDKHDRKVDYVLTHTCPARMIPEFAMFKLDNVFCATGKFLNEVDNLMEFKEWHFGHMHVEETYIDDDEGNQDSYTCHYNNPVYELK